MPLYRSGNGKLMISGSEPDALPKVGFDEFLYCGTGYEGGIERVREIQILIFTPGWEQDVNFGSFLGQIVFR